MGLTQHQQQAIHAEGDVLLLAGAGAGKTQTLVQRCLDRLLRAGSPASLDRMLMVTFTEAASSEMRHRIRLELQQRLVAKPENSHLAEQLARLDTAHIGTLHSFCFRLVKDHFDELQLDPQLQILDDTQAHLLAAEALDELLERHYRGGTEADRAVQDFIVTHGRGHEDTIRRLIRRVHAYSQTLPDPEAWMAEQQQQFSQLKPLLWLDWLLEAVTNLRDEWMSDVRASRLPNLQILTSALEHFPGQPSRTDGVTLLAAILEADQDWHRAKTRERPAFKGLFDTAAFLAPLANIEDGNDPLVEDWNWLRPHLLTLMNLVREFDTSYAATKRQNAALDFHDLEQFVLRLLWDRAANAPSAIARLWRKRLDHVFVDEYQDINAAQDRIITALSRDGAQANRFLVGDVKQCIYRFRLANPRIFQRYAEEWDNSKVGRVTPCAPEGEAGTLGVAHGVTRPTCLATFDSGPSVRRAVIPLADNFRSREAILGFINEVFAALMRRELDGVEYDDAARLRFGQPAERTALALSISPPPAVELLLQLTSNDEMAGEAADDDLASLNDLEREARQLALRFARLRESGFQVWDHATKGFRPARWSDMVVLLRAPSGKSSTFAQEFDRVGVPLAVAGGDFYQETEITDLLSLLQLLDNPLQDGPVIAVLRSPLAGLTLDELALVRLALPSGRFWTALQRFHEQRSAAVPAAAVLESSLQAAARADTLKRELQPAHAKVSAFLKSFTRWRKLARQASLSQCLEAILDASCYEDWLLTQDRGESRRANVQRLLALTRRFDVFQRQGLHRFQRFVEAQRDAEASPEPAAPEARDCVRLMSIHKSKGLEFPIVAVAGLGGKFNLSADESGVLLDEQYGLCARIKPPGHEGRYPSLPFHLAQARQRRESLGEELRLLYVAMTRACDRLILSGTTSRTAAEKWSSAPAAGPLPYRGLVDASHALGWLGPLISRLTEQPGWIEQANGADRWLAWRLTTEAPLEEALGARTAMSARTTAEKLADMVVRAPRQLRPTAGEPVRTVHGIPSEPDRADPPLDQMNEDESFALLKTRLAWRYAHLDATRQPAKGSVSALRRRLDEVDEEAQPFKPSRPLRPRRAASQVRLSSAEIGLAHHRFLEHVDLRRTAELVGLREESARLVREGFLRTEEAAQLDLHGIASFWQTDLGTRLRANAAAVKRELEFTARLSTSELAQLGLLGSIPPAGSEIGAPASSATGEDFLVIQGVADLVALLPDALWLVDFKTDQLDPDEVAARLIEHGKQLRVYARALERIHCRPVKECAVCFLALRRVEQIEVSST